MNLFEQLAGKALAGVLGGAAGKDGAAIRVIGDLLADGRAGGLDGLVNKFSEAGLGEIVKSWISTGANKAITAEQLSRVLNPADLTALAEKAGLKTDDLLGALSTQLPKIVDALTPDGKLPEGGLLEQGLKVLRGLK